MMKCHTNVNSFDPFLIPIETRYGLSVLQNFTGYFQYAVLLDKGMLLKKVNNLYNIYIYIAIKQTF